MPLLNPPAYGQAGTYDAGKDRQYLVTSEVYKATTDNSRGRNGLLPDTAAWSAPVSFTGWNWTVGPFRAIVGNTYATNGGDYKVINTSNETGTITASSPTTNRIDVLGVHVLDPFYTGAVLLSDVVAIEGTPSAGTPAAPALPASFMPLYQLTVNANSSTPIVTDLRRRTGMLGSLVNVFPIQLSDVGSYPGEQQLLPVSGAAPERMRYWAADGRWKGVSAFQVESGAVANPGVAQTATVVAPLSLSIPDPGYQYKLKFFGQLRINMGVGTGVDVIMRTGSMNGPNITPLYSIDGRAPGNQPFTGQYVMFPIANLNTTGNLSGAQSVFVTLVKWLGGGGDGWNMSSEVWSKIWAEVVPV
jgi:hypothetical protein